MREQERAIFALPGRAVDPRDRVHWVLGKDGLRPRKNSAPVTVRLYEATPLYGF